MIPYLIAVLTIAVQTTFPEESASRTMAHWPYHDVLMHATRCCPFNADQQADPEVKRVEAVAHGLMAADNVRDVEQVVELYAPDAIMLPPNESPVEGIAAIRPRYEAFFETHQPALRFIIEETRVVNNLAYVRGRTRGTIRDLGRQTEQTINDVFLMILKRTDSGAWKISRLMWHAAGGEK